MKIAVTADLHLTSRAENPERFETLECLLSELPARGAKGLLIAGDLFDASRQNYSEFEKLCRDFATQDLTLTIIPGNHDPDIDDQKIVAGNVRIVSSPSIQDIDGRTFLFLPYRRGTTMGEEIEPFREGLPSGEWVLVAHGDWAGGLRTHNATEPGVYMPLTKRDIELYRPARVFLGHIHRAMDAPPVHYPGSPCGLDITETGRRRCLLYDTDTNRVEASVHPTPIIHLDESFVIVPTSDEIAYIRAQIETWQKKWALTSEERVKTKLRVKVSGYSVDRAALRETLLEAFEGFTFYAGAEPDIDDVSSSDDVDKNYIADQVRANVKTLAWPDEPDQPSADEILLEALHIVYRR